LNYLNQVLERSSKPIQLPDDQSIPPFGAYEGIATVPVALVICLLLFLEDLIAPCFLLTGIDINTRMTPNRKPIHFSDASDLFTLFTTSITKNLSHWILLHKNGDSILLVSK
jgi:hypothetical protein